MAGESSKTEQGVPNFEYSPGDERYPLLFELSRPLDDLKQSLLTECAGQRMTFKELYRTHSVGRAFIDKNYREVLADLENAGLYRSADLRRNDGPGTFPDDVVLAFPPKTTDGVEFSHRMDGSHVEPGNGVHEGERWLQKLLRRAAGERLHEMGNHRYVNGFSLTLHPDALDLPRTWKTGRRIFVNSMSDLFHRDVPLSFIHQVFERFGHVRSTIFKFLPSAAAACANSLHRSIGLTTCGWASALRMLRLCDE